MSLTLTKCATVRSHFHSGSFPRESEDHGDISSFGEGGWLAERAEFMFFLLRRVVSIKVHWKYLTVRFDRLHMNCPIRPIYLGPPQKMEVLQLCSHPVVGSQNAPPGIFGLWSIQVVTI